MSRRRWTEIGGESREQSVRLLEYHAGKAMELTVLVAEWPTTEVCVTKEAWRDRLKVEGSW